MPSAILSAIVARIAKTVSLALLATCLPAVAHGQLADAAYPHASSLYTDPLGRTSRWSYAGGHLASATAADGAITTYRRDAQGRAIAQSTPTRLAWGQTAQTVQSQSSYDARGNRIRSTDALSQPSQSEYDAAGQLIKQTSPSGLVTRYSYSARGEQTRIEHPDGLADTWSWDAEGNETQSCSAASASDAGLCTQTEYDLLGRPIKTTDPAGGITQRQYDAAGQLIQSTDPLGRNTRYSYDAAGRPIRVTDPLGHSSQSQYNAAGQLTQSTAADGKTTTYQYDAAGRRTRTTWPSGASRQSHYDAAGQKTADTDEAGHTSRYSYDALGRLTQTTLPSGAATDYEWNEAGQLLAQTDALGRRTTYGYDALGRRTHRTLANGQQEGSAWNPEGQITSQTHLDGSQSTYSYQQGRLIGQTRADGHLTIGHDRHGRANHYSDSQRGLLTLALDKLGRQSSETTAHGPTQTQWDAASQRTQLSAHFENHSPHTIKATWDAGGRLQSLKANTNPSGPITRFTHDAAGRLTQIKRTNGTSSHYQYSADGHLTEIHHQSASGQTLARYRYERDAKGRLTQASEQTAGQSETIKTWQYDADGKLTRESTQQAGQSRTCTYQHDRVGNRTEKDCDGHKTSYSYNELNQLTQESSPSHTIHYRWDARGNLIEKQTPQQTTHYRWSADNRLTEVQSGNTRVSYGYDALGRRISRTWQQGNHTRETQWVLDTARPYSEIVLERTRQNGGAWKERAYVHTPDGVGLQISESEEGQTRHIYTDAQGSTRLITDEAGNVLQTLDYDAFGNEQTSGPTRHRYTGESFDSATGLYHLRARDYDPRTGRFISMDEHPGSRTIPLTLNKYLYGNADPVNHIDPSGNMSLGSVGASLGGMANMATMSLVRMEIADMFSRALLSPIINSVMASFMGDRHNIRVAYGNAGMAKVLTSFAVLCRVTKKCVFRKIPVMVNGFSSPETSRHIWDALMGNGGTSDDVPYPLSFILLKGPGRDDVPSNIRNISVRCGNRPVGFDCDEYPYASTFNGGEMMYNLGGVSLRAVPRSDNRAQGAKLKWFYAKNQIGIRSPFINLAIPFAPNFYIDKHGKAHF